MFMTCVNDGLISLLCQKPEVKCNSRETKRSPHICNRDIRCVVPCPALLRAPLITRAIKQAVRGWRQTCLVRRGSRFLSTGCDWGLWPSPAWQWALAAAAAAVAQNNNPAARLPSSPTAGFAALHLHYTFLGLRLSLHWNVQTETESSCFAWRSFTIVT